MTNHYSPWGHTQHEKELGAGTGIIEVDTASHGGIYVPDEQLSRIPEKMQTWAAEWSGSRNWYEEDCCWAAVAVSFPELFKPEVVEAAKRTLDHYFPEVK